MKRLFFIFITVILMIMSALFYNETAQAVSCSITLCLTVIIPSMYGFLILSTLIVKSNAYIFMGRPFRLLSEKIFNIPCSLFSVYILSAVAGYPTGAKLINELAEKKKITDAQATGMMCYCYSGGAAFILGTVGARLYSDIGIGIIIFVSVTLANFIAAILLRKSMGKATVCKENEQTDIDLSSETVISSVQSAAYSIFQMCIMITAFSFFFKLAEKCGIIQLFTSVLEPLKIPAFETVAALFEVSRIIDFSKDNYANIPLISFLLSFGGICVIMQVNAIRNGKIKMMKFIAFRIFCALLSSFFSYCFAFLFLSEKSIHTVTSAVKFTEYSIIPSVFMIIMTILLFLKKDWTK